MRSKFCVCRILEMMLNFVRSAYCAMKLKLNCPIVLVLQTSSKRIQSERIF